MAATNYFKTPDLTIEFDGRSNLKYYNLSTLINGSNKFYRLYGAKPFSVNCNFPELTNGSFMFTEDPLTSFTGLLPKLVNGYMMFNGITRLKHFDVGGILPVLENGYGMFTYNYNFNTPISLPSLKDGTLMFKNCTVLTAENINFILNSLPDYSGTGETHVIDFLKCAGSNTCDTSIGTNKGWTVNTI